MKQEFGLQAMGLATPIGVGKRAVAERLFAGDRAGLVPRSDLLPGRTLYIGAVEQYLPALPERLSS